MKTWNIMEIVLRKSFEETEHLRQIKTLVSLNQKYMLKLCYSRHCLCRFTLKFPALTVLQCSFFRFMQNEMEKNTSEIINGIIRGCIQKFQSGARIANGTALCH
jgi:hypothetical protein